MYEELIKLIYRYKHYNHGESPSYIIMSPDVEDEIKAHIKSLIHIDIDLGDSREMSFMGIPIASAYGTGVLKAMKTFEN